MTNKKTLNDFKSVTIGDCTLYHGDCLEILPLLGGVDSIVTDPPYGMNFVSNYRKDKHRAIKNDENTTLLSFMANYPVYHSKYIWMRWDNIYDVPKPKSLITWVKNNHSMGDLKHEHGRKTEVIAFYNGKDHFFHKRPTDVIYGVRSGNNLHPTQKPIRVMEQNVSWTNGKVVDPFMGSGSTGVACVNLNRKFIGIELDEDYFNLSVQRIQEAYDNKKTNEQLKESLHDFY